MKKNKKSENYLEKIPIRKEDIEWSVAEDELVTLSIENKGVFNRIAQKLLKKPKISYIHLDKIGSFVWPLMDGEKDIAALGILLKEKYGDEVEPLYERIAKYFQILDSYSFIEWK